MIGFQRLRAIRLVSHDPARLAEFYVAALGFARGRPVPITAAELAELGLAGSGSRIPLKLAGQVLEIDRFDPPGAPYPERRASDDRLFQHFAMVAPDLPAAWARVLAHGGEAISPAGPVRLPPANGNVRAAKFRDPEGHPLELLAFPEPAAPQPAIDHSAIVVRDVAASIAFYQARGLAVGERTCNQGAAQAALDRLASPRVDVVALHPPGTGPHLELLGYHRPVARAEPRWRLRDVAATRLVWEAASAGLIIDPDGHAHHCQP